MSADLGGVRVVRVSGRTADGTTKLRGEGVGLYRPSPRQLRRSSPNRMMPSTLAESRGSRGSVSVCGTEGASGTKSAVYHSRPGRGDTLAPLCINRGCGW
ncbi:hypothetical protein B9W62_26085 [Streptomyces sp. CS113]|nr:hypothetical protein B9W62_26085 [Streptomyces sp. CS113]